MEDEYGFQTQTRKRSNMKVYHLSRKANHYNNVLVDVDDFHTSYYMGNYGDTEEEGQQYGDLLETSVSSQENLNLPQENSTSDLDDSFQSCHEKSDNRRKAQCKRLER